MKSEEFVKEVMHRGGLESRLKAQDAIRATLETLSEHLTYEEAAKLASQLPQEVATYLKQPFSSGIAERFSLDEFILRVSEREGVERSEATRNAHIVASVLNESVSPGQIEHMRAQLPADLADFFSEWDTGKQRNRSWE